MFKHENVMVNNCYFWEFNNFQNVNTMGLNVKIFSVVVSFNAKLSVIRSSLNLNYRFIEFEIWKYTLVRWKLMWWRWVENNDSNYFAFCNTFWYNSWNFTCGIIIQNSYYRVVLTFDWLVGWVRKTRCKIWNRKIKLYKSICNKLLGI